MFAAQRYLDFYPGDEDAAYAQYLMALAYYDQIDEVGRDQGLTFQALQIPDIQLLEGTFLLFSFSVIVMNLLADLLYRVLDPRVRAQ